MDVRTYFKHLDLIQEELDLIGLSENGLKICDYGCGSGITTYGLALQIEDSECFGIDKFDGESTPTLNIMVQFTESIKSGCEERSLSIKIIPDELCNLIRKKRSPVFLRGDIVLGKNIPRDLDLAYIKRVLINIYNGKHGNIHSGKKGLELAIKHIAGSVRPGGLVCAIEFDGLMLDEYFLEAGLSIVNSVPFKRKDIRSRGRTTVISQYVVYLCQKL